MCTQGRSYLLSLLFRPFASFSPRIRFPYTAYHPSRIHYFIEINLKLYKKGLNSLKRPTQNFFNSWHFSYIEDLELCYLCYTFEFRIGTQRCVRHFVDTCPNGCRGGRRPWTVRKTYFSDNDNEKGKYSDENSPIRRAWCGNVEDIKGRACTT